MNIAFMAFMPERTKPNLQAKRDVYKQVAGGIWELEEILNEIKWNDQLTI